MAILVLCASYSNKFVKPRPDIHMFAAALEEKNDESGRNAFRMKLSHKTLTQSRYLILSFSVSILAMLVHACQAKTYEDAGTLLRPVVLNNSLIQMTSELREKD